VNHQDCRGFLLLCLIRNVQVRGHANAGPGLDRDLFDKVAFSLQWLAVALRVEIARRFGEATPRREELFAEFGFLDVPLLHRGGRLVFRPELGRLPADELKVLLVRGNRIGREQLTDRGQERNQRQGYDSRHGSHRRFVGRGERQFDREWCPEQRLR
jgi:hypothetical protein